MKPLFLAMLVSLPAIVFAQANYHEGFVVKNNGDTLKGYIDYREWAYSPTSIEFRSGNNTAVTEFRPDAIKGFQITGFESYASYTGPASTGKNIFPDLSYGLDTTSRQMAIFLKQLVVGNNVALYYNNEQYKRRFFIAEKNEPPAELKYYDYYSAAGGEEVFDNLFRGQLMLLNNKFRNGSQKLLNLITEARYDESDLEHITRLLNDENVNNSPVSQNSAAHQQSVRFFAGVGVNDAVTNYKYAQSVVSTTSGNGTNTTYNYVSYNSTTIAPKFNLGLDVFINPNVQQFIFRTELSFSYSNGLFNRTVGDISGNAVSYNYKFTQYTTSITPQFLYNFYNTDKLKFYIDGGLTLNLSSYTNNNANEPDQTPLVLNSFWAYFPFQAGIVFNKKTEVYLTYTTSASFSNYSDFSVSNQYISAGFKYFF